MDALERMQRALRREEGELPDRVPLFAQGMMGGFKQKTEDVFGDDIEDEHVLIAGADFTLSKFYGFDSCWVHGSSEVMKPLNGIDLNAIDLGSPNRRLGRFGGISEVVERNGKKVGAYDTGYLNTKELWNEWIDAGYFEYEISNEWIRHWEKQYPIALERDFAPIPVTVFFEKIREAFTFGKFSYFTRKERPFLENLTHRIFKMGMDIIKGWLDAGFDIVSIADDTAYKNRVMFSPKLFEEMVAPEYKKMIDYIHKRGALTFYHSDGYTEPFFPGLIGAGFDGIESLEPLSGMDLKHLKETYGKDLTLLGNMDCSQTLCFSPPEEVIAATRKCLDDGMEGGGYVLCPCTDIIDSCNPHSIKIMCDTVRKFGKYE
jgi:uroporphyrinogen decarboxylase-like protein